MIKNQPFTSSGQLRPRWAVSKQSSKSATTYLGPETIVQRRPAALFGAWVVREQILRSIDDPRGLLSAAKSTTELDEQQGYFWVAYQRQDLPDSPAHQNFSTMDAEQLTGIFTATLPDVLP